MDIFSSFVENLTCIIQKETENSLGSLFSEKIVDDICDTATTNDSSSHLTPKDAGALPESFGISHVNEIVNEESDTSVNNMITELSKCCHQLLGRCFEPDVIFERPLSLRCSFPIDSSIVSDVMVDVLQSLSSQLENVLVKANTCKTETKDKQIWSSIVLSDFEQAINLILLDCSRALDQKFIPPSHIRLGRVYAWARDQSTYQPDENTSNVDRTRKRLCRRLCRLVWLTRAGKCMARSHPFLVSLRHELLRIRTRVTGKLFSERTAAMGLTTSSGMLPWDDNSYLSVQRTVPDGFSTAFEYLIGQVVEILMDLPPNVPGLSLDELPDSDSLANEDMDNRRERLRQLVTRTVLNFYNQLDVNWADATSEQQQLPMYIVDADPMVSDDEEQSTKQHQWLSEAAKLSSLSEAEGNPMLLRLNPALVQAVLDRFDHYIRGSHRKRPLLPSNHSAPADDGIAVSAVGARHPFEDLPTAKKSRWNNDNNTEECGDSIAISPSSCDVMEPKESTQVLSDIQDSMPVPDDTGAVETPITDNITSAINVSCSSEPPASVTKASDPHQSSGVRRKAVCRSLRSRITRTPPSDASYSEGEVLSSDEEEEGVIDSDTEAVPRRSIPTRRAATPPELLLLLQQQQQHQQDPQLKPPFSEMVKVIDSFTDDLDDEGQQQSDNTTPVASDIDLTELEIMDEWAPPNASAVKNDLDSLCNAMQMELDNSETKLLSPEEQEAAKLFLLTTDRSLSDLVQEALSTCQGNLETLILNQRQKTDEEGGDSTSLPSSDRPVNAKLSDETEAAIERTASSFKEHVTSILANLLHAVPTSLDANSVGLVNNLLKSKGAHRNSSQSISARRASRLRGMLRAYQQEAARRLPSKPVASTTAT